MRIGRTIPPAASPIYLRDILNGLKGLGKKNVEIERLRSELKTHFDVKYCYLVSSGKAALTLTLEALHDIYPHRDEVLIPAFICYSVPSAIMRADLQVKLCDVNEHTLDFDRDHLKKILTNDDSGKQPPSSGDKKLLAVLPTHLFGLAADVERIKTLIKDPEISVVEDAAQVFGMSFKGKRLGTRGDVGFLSLGRGKVLSAVEGGVIFTNRDDLAESIKKRLLQLSGYDFFEILQLVIKAIVLFLFQHPMLFWLPKSLPFLKIGETAFDSNFKMRRFSAFQAGLLRDWRKKLNAFMKERSANSEALSNIIKRENNLKGIVTCFANGDRQNCRNHNKKEDTAVTRNESIPFIRYPVIIRDAELWKDIMEVSNQKGLGVTHTYPSSVNQIPAIEDRFNGQSYATAERLPCRLLTLPVHPYVTENDFLNLSMILKELVKKRMSTNVA